jgi:hypothetical protein
MIGPQQSALFASLDDGGLPLAIPPVEHLDRFACTKAHDVEQVMGVIALDLNRRIANKRGVEV